MKKKTPVLKRYTDVQEERMKRDLAIYQEFQLLTADEKQSKTKINDYLMDKYGIHSSGTLYAIRKRVEERIKQGGGLK